MKEGLGWLCFFCGKEGLCVCEIKEVIGLSQPTISSHLKLLEAAGLVESKKEGIWVKLSQDSR
ncbi:MAG: metalloregulator ArsR/SmtB family transcription factor [Actinomycetota bacterium]|nr:metalloregulator ArsR/SmtB family transcription factor [Actinomycetota bacterium]